MVHRRLRLLLLSQAWKPAYQKNTAGTHCASLLFFISARVNKKKINSERCRRAAQ